MNVSLLSTYPDDQSFSHAIAKAAVEQLHDIGHKVTYQDLYAADFDPALESPEIPTGVFYQRALRRIVINSDLRTASLFCILSLVGEASCDFQGVD